MGSRMTRLVELLIILLVIPNPSHNEIGDGGKEAISDDCDDINHPDSLPACTRYHKLL
jgi:hypothetical protein